MRKRLLTAVIIAVCCLAVILIVHFTKPETKIKGTWQGEGTLDLLGETAFDGAVEITFLKDDRGIVKGRLGQADFRYSMDTKTDLGLEYVFVEIDDRTLALEYRIDGNVLSLNESIFIKQK